MPVPQRKHIKEQLIQMLSIKGGMAVKDIYNAFVELWGLSPAEIAEKRGGESLYENEIRWARQELVQEGVLDKPDISGRGIWQLSGGCIVAEEYDEFFSGSLVEGAFKKVWVNVYERSRKARDKCVEVHGCSCVVCGFDFQAVYGEIGKGRIHAHHLIEISSIGKEYVVDPAKDMVPVCPNCHYMIHQRKPAFSVEEVRTMLEANKPSKDDYC